MTLKFNLLPLLAGDPGDDDRVVVYAGAGFSVSDSATADAAAAANPPRTLSWARVRSLLRSPTPRTMTVKDDILTLTLSDDSSVSVPLPTHSSGGGTGTMPVSDGTLFFSAWHDDHNFAGFFDVAAPAAVPAGAQTVEIPVFDVNSHLIFAQPSTARRITSIALTGLNQISDFDFRPAAAQHDGVDYDFWISQNLLYHTAVSGATVTLGR